MINSRKLEDLSPEARVICEKQIALCKSAGIDILVFSTYRDYEEQDFLYAQSRTRPGTKVTDAKSGQSFHNFRAAWDAVPLEHGQPVWDERDPKFQIMLNCARVSGAKCGADWKGWKDYDHFEVNRGLSASAAKALFDKYGTIFGKLS